MENLIGREAEIQLLQTVLNSSQAELLAVYGRRRVGKTYLIRKVYEKELIFEFAGLNQEKLPRQLENFALSISTAFDLPIEIAIPTNWLKAFRVLIKFLEPCLMQGKKVVFFDEFPWLDTPKSGFLAAFDHFWNSWASKQSNLVVVICGSAASWMIQNVVKNKGGLHNRITRRIRLMPFNLYETEQFLRTQQVNLDRYQIIQLYMITGGVPHYLRDIRAGESATQAIDRLCFSKDGSLREEFSNLYFALFEKADRHIMVVKALANKPSGMTRSELLTACQLSSGGSVSKLLEELLESGFISESIPFHKTSKETIFKLSDAYSLFYLKFIENSKSLGEGTWLNKSTSPSWKSWSGLAFENIWLTHLPQVKKALGISGIYTEQSAWRFVQKGEEQGVQIDLLIDRNDNCINLCEIKFSQRIFTLEKKYAEQLNTKRLVFLEKTSSKKTVFITLLTTFGATKNEAYLGTVQNQLTMDILFEKS
ncbi:MAG: AAA family ATPase [Bacteroidia bacterium]